MKKKSEVDVLTGTTIFVVLVIAFSFLLWFFITRAGTQAGIPEQTYAKEIALVIDKAKPGTEVVLDLSELYQIAYKNKFKGKLVEIEDNKVVVSVASGEGYEYNFFNDADVLWDLRKDRRELYIGVV